VPRRRVAWVRAMRRDTRKQAAGLGIQGAGSRAVSRALARALVRPGEASGRRAEPEARGAAAESAAAESAAAAAPRRAALPARALDEPRAQQRTGS
jgi:hypothetical protein